MGRRTPWGPTLDEIDHANFWLHPVRTALLFGLGSGLLASAIFVVIIRPPAPLAVVAGFTLLSLVFGGPVWVWQMRRLRPRSS